MEQLKTKNRKLAVILFGMAAFMVVGAYASVPLYRLFCQVTGYAGTPGRADSVPLALNSNESGERISVFFNTDTKRNQAWRFGIVEKRIELGLGESKLAFFHVENLSRHKLITRSTFNVTPLKAAQYVIKTECFCFEEQVLLAEEFKEMPMSFYIDPAIHEDPQTRDVSSITLSYTLFAESDVASKAIQHSQTDGG